MLVAISHGHRGKPRKGWGDWGANAGISLYSSEAYHLYSLIADLDAELSALGHGVVVLSDGEFADRWKRADAYGANLYLAAHLNAGGGDYGAMFYDHRSKAGPVIAETIATSLGAYATPDVRQRAIAASPLDWTKNAYATIAGVKATALCMEPLFLDNPEHASYLNPWGVHNIAKAIATAIDEWSKQ